MYLCTSESSALPHVQYSGTHTTTSLPLHADHSNLSHILPEHCSLPCPPFDTTLLLLYIRPCWHQALSSHSWPAAPWCSVFWSLLYNIEFLPQQQGACKECKNLRLHAQQPVPESTFAPDFQVTCACMEKEHCLEAPVQGQRAAVCACTMHHTSRSFCSILSLCTLLSLKKPWQLAVQ